MSAFSSFDSSSAFEDTSSLNVTFSYLDPKDNRLYHEVSPKSNYTYAYSGSYQTDLLHRQWRSPNLSRSPLHSPDGAAAAASVAGTPSSTEFSAASLVNPARYSSAASSATASSVHRRRISASSLSLSAATTSESDRVLRSRCRAEGGAHCGHVDCRLHGVSARRSQRVRFSERRGGQAETAGEQQLGDEESDEDGEEKGAVEASMSRPYYYEYGSQRRSDFRYGYYGPSRTSAMTTTTTTTTTTRTSMTATRTARQTIASALVTLATVSGNAVRAAAQYASSPIVSAFSAVKNVVKPAASSASRSQQQRRVGAQQSWCWLVLLALLLLPLAALIAWWFVVPSILAALRDANSTRAGLLLGLGDGCCDSRLAADLEQRWAGQLDEMRAQLNLLARQRKDDEAQQSLLLQRLAQQSNSPVGSGIESADKKNASDIGRQIALLRQADAEQLQLTASVSNRLSQLEQAQLNLASELSGRFETMTERISKDDKLGQQRWSEQKQQLTDALKRLDTVDKWRAETSSEQQQLQLVNEQERRKLADEVDEYDKRLTQLQQAVSQQKLLVTAVNNRLEQIEDKASESANAERQQQQLVLELQQELAGQKNMILVLQKGDSENKARDDLITKRLDSVELEADAASKLHLKSEEERQKIIIELRNQLGEHERQLAELLKFESELRKQASGLSERLAEVQKLSLVAVKPDDSDNAYQTLKAEIDNQFNNVSQQISSLRDADSEQRRDVASISERLAAVENYATETKSKIQFELDAKQQKPADDSPQHVAEQSKLLSELKNDLAQHHKQLESLQTAESEQKELANTVTRRLSSVEALVTALTAPKPDAQSDEKENLTSNLLQQITELKDQLAELQKAEIEQNKLFSDISDRLKKAESMLASTSTLQKNDASEHRKLLSDIQEKIEEAQTKISLLQQADVQQSEAASTYTVRFNAVEKIALDASAALQESDAKIDKQLAELQQQMADSQKLLLQLQESEILLKKSTVDISERIESVRSIALSNHENQTSERFKLGNELADQQKLLQQMQQSESELVKTVGSITERLESIESALATTASLTGDSESGKRRKSIIDLRQHLSDYQNQLEQLRAAESEQNKLVESIALRLTSVESTLSSSESKQASSESEPTSLQVTEHNQKISLIQEKLKEHQEQINSFTIRFAATEKMAENASDGAKKMIEELRQKLSDYQHQLAQLERKESDQQTLLTTVSEKLATLEATMSASSASSETEFQAQKKQKAELERQLNAYQRELNLLKVAEAEQRKLAAVISDRLTAMESASALSTKLEMTERLNLTVIAFEQQLKDHHEQLILLKQFSTDQLVINANFSERFVSLEALIASSTLDKKAQDEDSKRLNNKLSDFQKQLVALKEAEKDLNKMAFSVSERLAAVESSVAALTSAKTEDAALQSKVTVELQQQFNTYQQQLIVLKEAEMEQRRLASAVTERLNTLDLKVSTLTLKEAEELKNQAENLKKQLKEHQRQLKVGQETLAANISERLNAMEASISAAKERQTIPPMVQQQLEHHQLRLAAVETSAAALASDNEGRQQTIAALQLQLGNHQELLAKLKDSAPVAGTSCNDSIIDDSNVGEGLRRQLAEHRRRLSAVERLASTGCRRRSCACNCSRADGVVADPFPNAVPDFALHSAGAYVVGTRCTVAYKNQASVVELFGFPVLAFSRSPTTALEPDTNLGECWAFQGFPGHLIVRLAVPARISSVTLDHAAREVSYNASMTSAPRNFTVYGLDSASASLDEATPLGSFVYNADSGPASQTFHLNATTGRYYEYVELVIESNHGNELYTCLYRFRVHGLA